MKLTFSFFIFIFLQAFLTTGCTPEGPSPDTEENRFYSFYRDIYKDYGKVPLDSTKIQLETYLHEFPENPDAWAFYGHFCFQQGSDKEAIASYLKAIQLDNEKATYYAGLGTVFSAAGKVDSAEQFLLKALQLKDSSANTLLNLSMLYLKKGDKEKSLAFADEAMRAGGNSALICAGLSYVYSRFEEKEKGLAAFERARALGLKDTSDFKNVLEGRSKIEDYYRTHSY